MKYFFTNFFTNFFIINLWLAYFSAAAVAQIGTSQSLQLEDSVLVVRVADIDSLVYDATRLINLTGTNLDVSYRMSPISAARYPAAWRNEIEYPNLLHYTNQATGSFKLNGQGLGARTVFISLLPYGQIGHDTLRVVFYPTDTPTDTIELLFVATAYTFVAVNEAEKAKEAIKIWPNPTAAELNIQAAAEELGDEKLNIRIFDQLGRAHLLAQTTAANLAAGLSIDTRLLAQGVYYLQIVKQDNRIIEHKIFIKI